MFFLIYLEDNDEWRQSGPYSDVELAETDMDLLRSYLKKGVILKFENMNDYLSYLKVFFENPPPFDVNEDYDEDYYIPGYTLVKHKVSPCIYYLDVTSKIKLE
jgi:hypothetical protein